MASVVLMSMSLPLGFLFVLCVGYHTIGFTKGQNGGGPRVQREDEGREGDGVASGTGEDWFSVSQRSRPCDLER